MHPEAITGGGDRRGMVPVRGSAENVSKPFWAKLAGHRGAGDETLFRATTGSSFEAAPFRLTHFA
jgi:hypothetical protein